MERADSRIFLEKLGGKNTNDEDIVVKTHSFGQEESSRGLHDETKHRQEGVDAKWCQGGNDFVDNIFRIHELECG